VGWGIKPFRTVLEAEYLQGAEASSDWNFWQCSDLFVHLRTYLPNTLLVLDIEVKLIMRYLKSL